MRLFVAVCFTPQVKEELVKTIQQLKAHALSGSFTRKENLHLTLAFLGETSRVEAAKEVVQQIQAEPFPLTLQGLGKFNQQGDALYWIGIEHSRSLVCLQAQLVKSLTHKGFALEKRPYRPHLTLGRRVVLEHGFDTMAFSAVLGPIHTWVDTVQLMESCRMEGYITYRSIAQKMLEASP